MRKWECGQKKDRWNTYYKMVEPPREKQSAKTQTEKSVS